MATSDIVSPSGLDLSPKPPNPVRVSKRAGILFLAIGAVVAGMILYGIVTRGDRQVKLGSQVNETQNMTAATDAGKLIASQIPARPANQSRDPLKTEELVVEPSPQTSSSSTPELQTPSAQTQPVQSNAPSPATPQYHEPTPEERRLALTYQREMEALDAPTASREGFTGSREAGAVASSSQSDATQLTQLLRNVLGGAVGANSGTGGVSATASGDPRVALGIENQSQAEEFTLQNSQEEKERFLEEVRTRRAEDYLGATRVKPLSEYEIKAGWDIPAILEQALNSDLPGEIKALVRENVYDTATGRHLLIPQGSRLVGLYDSRVAYGQDGVQVAWNRIIFPDASTISLEGMAGQDAQGYTGLRHDVDNHYKRIIGTTILTSAFSAAYQLSQTRPGTVLAYPSPSQLAGSAAASNISQVGNEITRRNVNVQPTIKVPIGYRFNVRVNRDLLFDGPYKPMQP